MKEQITVVLNIVLKTILLHKVFDYFAPSLRAAQISKSMEIISKFKLANLFSLFIYLQKYLVSMLPMFVLFLLQVCLNCSEVKMYILLSYCQTIVFVRMNSYNVRI
jgi:hypothetical protein